MMNYFEEIMWHVHEFLGGSLGGVNEILPHYDLYAELIGNIIMSFLIVLPFIIFWKIFRFFIP